MRRELCLLTVLGLSACSHATIAAQSATARFQEDNFCPSERTIATVRTDLVVHDFACADKAAPWTVSNPPGLWWLGHAPDESRREQLARCGASPPPAVAADPERLALWNKREMTLWAAYDSGFSPVVQVSGCGRVTLYACKWGHKRREPNCSMIVLETETIPR